MDESNLETVDITALGFDELFAIFEGSLEALSDRANAAVMELMAAENPGLGASIRQQYSNLLGGYTSLFISDMMRRSLEAGQHKEFISMMVAMYPSQQNSDTDALRQRILHRLDQLAAEAHAGQVAGDKNWPNGDPDSF